jgi:hypothetical protein
MKKITVISLGSTCTDKATGLNGILTHWYFNTSAEIAYLFQPNGLNPETGQPIEKIQLEIDRLEFDPQQMEEVEVPDEILLTQVTDKGSGFTGMAIGFIRHINGCFHVMIQPKGTLNKTGSPVKRADFDLRLCDGEAIKKLSAEERKKSEQRNPSPTGDSFEDIPMSEGKVFF